MLQRKAIGLLVGLLLAWEPAAAQGLARRSLAWEQLQALKPGTGVAVQLKNGMTVKGKLSSVSDNALSLGENRNKRDIDRSDIARIDQFRRRVGRDTWKGTRIGYKITAPFRHVLGNGCTGDRLGCFIVGAAALAVIVVVIPVGTVGGLTVGLTHKHQELMYQAP
jgi:hypothetical protein